MGEIPKLKNIETTTQLKDYLDEALKNSKATYKGRKFEVNGEKVTLNQLVRVSEKVLKSVKSKAEAHAGATQMSFMVKGNVEKILKDLEAIDQKGNETLKGKGKVKKAATAISRFFGNDVVGFFTGFNRDKSLKSIKTTFDEPPPGPKNKV